MPGSFVRTTINNRTYPCSGGSYFCGQVLSGSVWDTREALFITEPDDCLTIIQDLTINSVLLHASVIDPGITIDFLTLDDNDGDGWNEVAMNYLGNDEYDAVFPAVDCPSVVRTTSARKRPTMFRCSTRPVRRRQRIPPSVR